MWGHHLASIYPVILCGGSGTRLWPASRSDQPKQFLKLVGERSSFQETVLRVKDIPGVAEIVIVTGEAMVEFVAQQTAEIGAPVTILVEPEARDSAPAVAAAAAYVERKDPDGVVLMLAADHHIAQPEIFGEAALTAARAAEHDLIVTFGVQPTVPATGFGYIRPGEALLDGSVRTVAACARSAAASGALPSARATTARASSCRFAPSSHARSSAASAPALSKRSAGSRAMARSQAATSEGGSGGPCGLSAAGRRSKPKSSVSAGLCPPTRAAGGPRRTWSSTATALWPM